MQNVGDEQLLVLLLVMQADFDDRKDPVTAPCIRRCDQPLDRLVDMDTIGRHFARIRPRNEAALRTRVPRTGGDIIGIEQEGEALVEHAIIRQMRHKQKLFEEPGRVRAMPFRRARIRHRLHDLILR